MSATKLNKNWSSVTVAGTTVAHVNSCAFGYQGQLLPYIGDNAVIPTVIALNAMHPHCSIVAADVYGLMHGCPPGTSGSIVATSPDALAAVGGAITYMLANAVVQDVEANGAWGAYQTATLTAMASSSDGTTNPLSMALA